MTREGSGVVTEIESGWALWGTGMQIEQKQGALSALVIAGTCRFWRASGEAACWHVCVFCLCVSGTAVTWWQFHYNSACTGWPQEILSLWERENKWACHMDRMWTVSYTCRAKYVVARWALSSEYGICICLFVLLCACPVFIYFRSHHSLNSVIRLEGWSRACALLLDAFLLWHRSK